MGRRAGNQSADRVAHWLPWPGVLPGRWADNPSAWTLDELWDEHAGPEFGVVSGTPDEREEIGIVQEPIHNAVGILPQEVLTMAPIAEWPPIGSLHDVIERSLNRFLKPIRCLFASRMVPTAGLFVVLGRGRQESELSHAALASVELAL